MPKVTIQLVVYNSKENLKAVLDSVNAQDFKDHEIIVVICGNENDPKGYLEQNYPDIKILDPGKNLGFAGGHNLAFAEAKGELIQLIGNDLILEPDYLGKMVKVFENPKVGSATGKLFGYHFQSHQKKQTLDTTGIILYENGRARDRGQHEVDKGQYDSQNIVVAVSGASPMYRKTAIEEAGLFDEDFFMYWEDVDLGLRLLHKGYLNYFNPHAVGYHGRATGSSEQGVKKFGSFFKHRQSVGQNVRKWNFKNHIFLVIKNFPKISFSFFKREILMFGYVCLLETRTLAVLPLFFRQLPKMLNKRKTVLNTSKISQEDFAKYFTHDEKELV